LTTSVIFDIEKFSIHDGPGIRTTVFLKGCPLSCAWCHNPESQARGPARWFWERRCIGCGACAVECGQQAISMAGGVPVTDDGRCVVCGECTAVCQTEAREIVGRAMTVAEVMAAILKDVPFYDESGGGVTFSGGEPLAQPEFLTELLRACRIHEIHTAVDTSGLAAWSTLQQISPLVDLFLYDLKVMDDARHRQYTGVSNRPILANLQRLVGQGSRVAVRMPVIPGINDDVANFEQMAGFLLALPRVPPVSLLPYHQAAVDKYTRLGLPYTLDGVTPPGDERMLELARLLQGLGLAVKIGG
jgi:pyruvate formate lyase activating enzyme